MHGRRFWLILTGRCRAVVADDGAEQDAIAGVVTVVVCCPDEARLDQISDWLVEQRFTALPIANPAGAVRLCRYGQPEFLILDLSFGDSAPEMLRVRTKPGYPCIPVLALSPPDFELGELGGDNPQFSIDAVLALPLDFDELLHRLVKLLRRTRDDFVVRVGVLVIDPPRHRVTVRGEAVHLTPKEFTMLQFLASDPLRVFREDELLREVWGWPSTSHRTQTVKAHASRLRRKLDPTDRRFVVNYRGIGWRLVNSLADAGPAVPDPEGGGQ
jgi:DNA-binding response OmpR family regulator